MQNGFTTGQLDVLQSFFGGPIEQLHKKIDALPGEIRREVNAKIAQHADTCAKIRWRNMVIFSLVGGAAGGGVSGALLRLMPVLFGGG